VIDRAREWLDRRTGYRRIREALLDEPLPPGTGWFFTLGSILLGLIVLQLLTGSVLTLYYAPTPDHAYDSVRFIDSGTAGRVVRGLHHFGASFLVVFLVLHMLRVIAFGSYKAPRELTWLSGLAVLALVLAFALTGYLLPWDRRAYWATVVTINISRLTPLAGDQVGAILQGGEKIGALTLTRWYAAHVIFLPAVLLVLLLAHLALMRRHGISGPVRPRGGAPHPFYPFHAARDAAAVLLVFSMLAILAWGGAPPLEPQADPTDGAYVPRPEWYFLGLFQLLKYFPGRLEVFGAIVLPGLVATLLALLPWIDRGPERDPRRRPLIIAAAAGGLLAAAALTALGWQDRPRSGRSAEAWSLRELGGRAFVEARGCGTCHAGTGLADPLGMGTLGRGAEWIEGHVADPEMIAPGLRDPAAPINEREAAAIMAYVRRLSQVPYPAVPRETEVAAAVYARHCIGCHTVDGEGGTDGPDLSAIGRKHDPATLRRWIADPEAVNPEAEMPSFEKRLTADELDAIAAYLSGRK
jgi:ubiquinol-cytochrome c reductase cytochrome b subunit